MARSCYSAPCRWYKDGPIGRIRYYFADPDAQWYMGDNVFWPYSQDLSIRNESDTGELTTERRVYDRGDNTHDLDGDHAEGSASDFAGESYIPWTPWTLNTPPAWLPHCDFPDYALVAGVDFDGRFTEEQLVSLVAGVPSGVAPIVPREWSAGLVAGVPVGVEPVEPVTFLAGLVVGVPVGVEPVEPATFLAGLVAGVPEGVEPVEPVTFLAGLVAGATGPGDDITSVTVHVTAPTLSIIPGDATGGPKTPYTAHASPLTLSIIPGDATGGPKTPYTAHASPLTLSIIPGNATGGPKTPLTVNATGKTLTIVPGSASAGPKTPKTVNVTGKTLTIVPGTIKQVNSPCVAGDYVCDYFTGSNGTLINARSPGYGGPWIFQFGSMKIGTNRAINATLSSGYARSVIETGHTSYTMEFDVNFQAKDVEALFPLVRFADDSNMVYCQASCAAAGGSQPIYIIKMVAGAGTILATGSASFTPGTTYHVSVTVTPTTVSFTINGVTLTATDSTSSSATKVGVQLGNGVTPTLGTTWIDNFRVHS